MLTTERHGSNQQQVVPQESAKIPGMVPIGIRANHMDMTKFVQADDPGFVAVCGELREWLNGITAGANPLDHIVVAPPVRGQATSENAAAQCT